MTVQSPPPPVTPAPKKGLGPLAWVGIGCGVLLVLGFIAFAAAGYFATRKLKEVAENPEMAAAELMIRANPDVELVEKDEDAKTFTIREKKTGNVYTLDLKDVESGNISFKSSEDGKEANVQIGEGGITVKDEKGESTMQFGGGAPADLPSWIPAYPGGQTQGNYSSNTPEGRSAGFVVSTTDSIPDVVAFYKEKFEGAGLEVTENTTATEGQVASAILSAKNADEKRTANVIVSTSDNQTQAIVSYTEKQ